jgi:hypothetical protein
MFEFVVAASIAFGAESVDGIFGKKSSSCSGGSCSAAPAVEKKPEASSVKKEEPAKLSCKSSARSHSRRGLSLGRRGCN